MGRATHTVGLLRALVMLFAVSGLAPATVLAEADTLAQGDVSLSVFESFDPFNRYWYHYQECEGPDGSTIRCSRFNLNSYEAMDVPGVYGAISIPDTLIATSGLRAELGVFDRLTVGGETQLVYSTQGEPRTTLGDSRIGLRWKASDQGPLIISVAGMLKIPGRYNANTIGSPGGGQYDVELKVLFGGLAARRKLFYDLGLGYRLRLPYRSQVQIDVGQYDYDSDEDLDGQPDIIPLRGYTITGPADEVFADAAIGFFATRRMLLFFNANAVNSTKGIHLDDYFSTLARTSELDAQGRPKYHISNEEYVSNLLTIFEEDYVRIGVGALFKAFASGTVYVNYAYTAIGQNTSAFYVLPNTRIPIGSLAIGLEYTFGLKNTPPPAAAASRQDDLRDTALVMRSRLSRTGNIFP